MRISFDSHLLLTPVAAVVRDTLYIDGGSLLWSPGLSDGTVGQPISDGEPSLY